MKLLLIILLTTFSFAGKINIAIAANVSYAIDDLKKEFNKLYPKIQVDVTLAGTGKLVAQIKHHAPYQILLAANMAYPKALYAEGFAVTKPRVYAQGSLVYLSKKVRDFSKIKELLRSHQIRRIAVANPKTAPYGKATFEALRKSKLLKLINSKFVFAESISQTVTYALKATDIGFIAKSTLFSPRMRHLKKGKNWADVDPKLYTPISQGAVILKQGVKNPEVRAFYDFLFSKKAQKTFERYGYIIPQK
jgi:molybdate transport system substrate-binding protein